MSSVRGQSSSGSDGDRRSGSIDDRKRKRMQSNRESARRSRMRKQKQLEDLTGEIGRLQIVNVQLVENIQKKEDQYVNVVSATNVLRAHAVELTDRLRFLNSILEIAEEVSGNSMDIPHIPEPLLEPWQIPHPMQPMLASSDLI